MIRKLGHREYYCTKKTGKKQKGITTRSKTGTIGLGKNTEKDHDKKQYRLTVTISAQKQMVLCFQSTPFCLEKCGVTDRVQWTQQSHKKWTLLQVSSHGRKKKAAVRLFVCLQSPVRATMWTKSWCMIPKLDTRHTVKTPVHSPNSAPEMNDKNADPGMEKLWRLSYTSDNSRNITQLQQQLTRYILRRIRPRLYNSCLLCAP